MAHLPSAKVPISPTSLSLHRGTHHIGICPRWPLSGQQWHSPWVGILGRSVTHMAWCKKVSYTNQKVVSWVWTSSWDYEFEGGSQSCSKMGGSWDSKRQKLLRESDREGWAQGDSEMMLAVEPALLLPSPPKAHHPCLLELAHLASSSILALSTGRIPVTWEGLSPYNQKKLPKLPRKPTCLL
jgi:hypothetical protein